MNLAQSLALGLKAKLYFKEFNKITGSVHCSLFLGQLIYWADKNDYKPFYKFRQPCEHELYREGDSWAEELDFEIRMIDKCIKTLKELEILETKININRVTYYSLNVERLNEILSKKDFYVNSKKDFYVNSKNAIYEHSKNAILLHNTNNTNSKITSNTTFQHECENSQNEKQESEKVIDSFLFGNSAKNRFLISSDKPSFVNDEVWQDFCRYKREKNQKVALTELKAFLSALKHAYKLGVDINARIIECISKGYKSPVLEPKNKAQNKAQGVEQSRQTLQSWANKKMMTENNEIIDGEVIDDATRIHFNF